MSNHRVRVIARVRPLSRAELGQGEDKVLSVSGCSLALHVAGQAAPLRSGTHSQTKNFKLDCVFDESSTQEEVFFYIEPLLQGFIEGYNTTIFTYGQSGTGKTYSMLGYDLWEIAEDSNSTNSRYSRSQQYSDDLELATARANMGIIPRSMEWLFLKATGLRGRGLEVRISVSYLEIYNEKLIDLLSSSEPCSSPVKGGFMSPNAPVKQSLDIREINKDITVSGLTLIEVQSAAEVMEILWIGARTRSIAATDLNEYSSRSHTVFQAYLELVDTEAMEVIRSKISLVDLAGSEKLKVHQITTFSQERIKELTYINRSLSSLSNCISALLQKSKVHVPYRDSKLTRLLQDSLGGNTRSAFIVTLSPSATCLEETISSLQFADRAMRVSIETRLNRSPLQCSPSKSGSNPTFVSSSAELISCKTEIVELKKMVEFLLTKCGDSTSAVDSTTLGDGEEFEVDDDLTEDTHLRNHETADQIQNQICERRRSQSSSSQVEVSSTRQLPPQSPLRNLKERIEASSRQVSGTSSDAPLRGLGPVDLLDTSSSLLYPSSTSASTTLPSSSTTSLPHSASLSPVVSITASTIVRQTSPNRRPSIRQLNGSRSSDSNTPGEDRSREAYIRRGNNIEGQQSDGRKIVREHSRSLWASEGLSEGRRSADRTEYSDDKEMTRESVRAGNESVGDDRVREDMGGVALKAERSNRQEGESQWRRKYHSWLSSTRNAQSTNANSSGQRGSSGQMDSPYRRIGGRSRRGPLSPSASSSSSNSNILLSYGTDGGGGGNGGGPVGGQESSDRSMIDRLRLMERSVIMQAEELATAKSLFLKTNAELQYKLDESMREREYLRSPEESRRSSRDSVISRDTAPSLAAASFSQCSTTSLPSLANLIFSPEPSTVGSPYRQIRSSGSFTHNHDGRVSTDRTKSGLHISPNQRLGTSSEIRSAEEVPEKCMTNSSGGRSNVDVRQDDGIETYELKNRDRNKGMLSARQLLRENLSSSEKQQVREVNREQGEEEGSSFDYDVFPALMSIECERVESRSKAYPAAIPSTSISRDDLCQDYHHPNTPTSSTPLDNGNQIHTPGRLKNPPKSLWAEYFDSVSGLLYYHNRSTKETKWERPTDDEMSLPLHLVSSLPDMT